MPQPSLLLIHGAATGAWIWDTWRSELRALGWQVNVLDVRGHGRSLPIDLSVTTIEDYVADVASVTAQIEVAQGAHPVIGGWGLGGLVALLYAAAQAATPALVLLSPDAPVEVAGRSSPDAVRAAAGGVLGPEAFGIFSADPERSREALFDLTDSEMARVMDLAAGAQESGIAWRQVLRGVSVTANAVKSPALVLYGDEEPEPQKQHSRSLAVFLAGESVSVPGVGRWGLVASGAAVAAAAPSIDAWLRRVL
ncbi:MAG TPA: alpha/beta hydrolase [Dehalococcoidia bacterium]